MERFDLKRTSGIVLLAVLVITVATGAFSIKVARSAGTWTVDDDGPANFTSIQGAINSSSVMDGDTVYVHSGTYHEHVFLNKSISLVGEDPATTIIDADAVEYFPALAISDVANIAIMNVTARNTTAGGETYGISIYKAQNLTLQNVVTEDAYYGVLVSNSNQCRIFDNEVRDCYNSGIVFRGGSSNNTAVGNLISSSPTGIYIDGSTHNAFYRNNIIDNTLQFNSFGAAHTSWDNGVEGNFWSDYEGNDVNGDGIGDENVPHFGVDYHPLIEPWNETRTYTVGSYQFVVNCNYTVASFAFDDVLNRTSFYVTGPAGQEGFCRVMIPKALSSPGPSERWMVFFGAGIVAHTNESVDNSTRLWFTYTLGASMLANRVRIRTGAIYPPTAGFEFAPDPATTIAPVNFTDTSTDSPNGTIVWRHWDFGDGDVADNETFVRHQFSSKAIFDVTLTVGDNNSLTDSVTLRVRVQNLPPSAAFSFSPADPSVGVGVSFNASDTVDLDGSIVEYRWNFDDSTVENTASPLVIHTFRLVGTYNVTLTAIDSDGEEDEAAQIISVGKGATSMDIDAPTSVDVGELLTISMQLLDANSQPLVGRSIRIEVNDGDPDFVRDVNTNTQGIATATLSLNATGLYTIGATYIGSVDYLPSESSASLAVNLKTTALTLHAPQSATQNGEITLSATLLDSDGNPVYNATVDFQLHNGVQWESLGVAQTNQSGIAALVHVPMQAGDFALRAVYSGDGKYAASASEEHEFTVIGSEVDYMPYIVVAAVVAAVAVVLVAIVVLRKRKGGDREQGSAK